MAFALTRRLPALSPKAFGYGIAVAGVVAGVGLGYLWIKGPETLAARESKLASQIVVIERDAAIDQTLPETISASSEVPVTEPAIAMGPPAPATTEPLPAEAHSETPIAPPPATNDAEPIAQDGALPPAPINGLYADGNEGRLPVIRDTDKMTPFKAYRRPFTPVAGKAVVSIALMDVGLSESISKTALAELPDNVSMVVNPYAAKPDLWVNESRNHGHEAWMVLPVESDFYPLNDSGPQTLMINAAERQNQIKLMWTMSRAQGYAGLVTGEAPAFMKSPEDVRPVMNDIYARGLGFVDGDISPADTAPEIANGLNSPFASASVWIDQPATSEHISASLRQLEVLAQSDRPAIGFIASSPLAIRMVKDWSATLEGKGIILAPLSAQAAK